MYDVIYNEFVDTDKEGTEVDESERFGLIQDILITHPNYLLFANESGLNTSQKDNGVIGGEKLVVEAGTIPQCILSTTDH